jgi:hypothetical protein
MQSGRTPYGCIISTAGTYCSHRAAIILKPPRPELLSPLGPKMSRLSLYSTTKYGEHVQQVIRSPALIFSSNSTKTSASRRFSIRSAEQYIKARRRGTSQGSYRATRSSGFRALCNAAQLRIASSDEEVSASKSSQGYVKEPPVWNPAGGTVPAANEFT